MRLILSPDLEQVIGEQSRHLGMSPENIVLRILRWHLIPEIRKDAVSLEQENRMAVLAKIRNGRYSCCPSSDNLLPSDSFAARKEEEKKQEERHWT